MPDKIVGPTTLRLENKTSSVFSTKLFIILLHLNMKESVWYKKDVVYHAIEFNAIFKVPINHARRSVEIIKLRQFFNRPNVKFSQHNTTDSLFAFANLHQSVWSKEECSLSFNSSAEFTEKCATRWKKHQLLNHDYTR